MISPFRCCLWSLSASYLNLNTKLPFWYDQQRIEGLIREGWQKLHGSTGGTRRKVRTRTKILSPNIRSFVADSDLSRFTHFLEIFGQKECLFGSKTVFLGQEVHYYMVYIAYFTELNLQTCDYAQKQRICRENCKYAFDENFHGYFCPRRKAAKFCHPDIHIGFLQKIAKNKATFCWCKR